MVLLVFILLSWQKLMSPVYQQILNNSLKTSNWEYSWRMIPLGKIVHLTLMKLLKYKSRTTLLKSVPKDVLIVTIIMECANNVESSASSLIMNRNVTAIFILKWILCNKIHILEPMIWRSKSIKLILKFHLVKDQQFHANNFSMLLKIQITLIDSCQNSNSYNVFLQ